MTAKRLNDILIKRYDIDLLRGPLDRDHLEFVFEHYSFQYRNEALCESTAQQSKAYLISETARLVLREIAPKRRKKKKKGAQ